MAEPCRSCGAPTFFAPSATSGKRMILNAEPVADGNVVLEDGRARVLRAGEEAPAPRYVTHFATCNDPKRWRGKK